MAVKEDKEGECTARSVFYNVETDWFGYQWWDCIVCLCVSTVFIVVVPDGGFGTKRTTIGHLALPKGDAKNLLVCFIILIILNISSHSTFVKKHMFRNKPNYLLQTIQSVSTKQIGRSLCYCQKIGLIKMVGFKDSNHVGGP